MDGSYTTRVFSAVVNATRPFASGAITAGWSAGDALRIPTVVTAVLFPHHASTKGSDLHGIKLRLGGLKTERSDIIDTKGGGVKN